MSRIRTLRTEHLRERRRIAEGRFEACCHVIDWWYDIGWGKFTDEDLQRLEEDAEARARESIAQDYISGQLCSVLVSPVRQKVRELFGWWKIVAD